VAGARILIADDHEVVRAGVRGMLASQPDWDVCAEAEDGRRAIALAVVLKPDLAVLDVAMPGLNGIDVTRRLRSLLPKTRVLVLTMHQQEIMVTEALNAGALGYVLKSDPVDVLVTAVQHVLAGQTYVSPQLCADPTGATFGLSASRLKDPLTQREREVLQLLSEGRGNKEIGSELGISPKTAETHRARLMAKLGLHSLASLVRYAVRQRIIEP
jgi:DNA-binding NarL/FixJ family response regulator